MTAVGRVSTVMVNCNDLDAVVPFWAAVLGVDVAERAGPYVWLGVQDGQGVAVAFQQVEDVKTARNRVHLDVAVPDLEAARGRVEELGGHVVERRTGGTTTWYIAADPEGNEFCLYEPHP
ncbi:MAG TPA: VOC family protein [Acidimicrobiales bacterium]|nr:VOC family protein [Acidimicrobiales bacterium]